MPLPKVYGFYVKKSIAIDFNKKSDIVCINMRHLSKKMLISVLATIVLVITFIIVKPIPFTKADVTISSNGDSTQTTPANTQVQSNDTPTPNPHIVISSNAPSDTPIPTASPVVLGTQTQNQPTQAPQNNCHQVCQEVCN